MFFSSPVFRPALREVLIEATCHVKTGIIGAWWFCNVIPSDICCHALEDTQQSRGDLFCVGVYLLSKY